MQWQVILLLGAPSTSTLRLRRSHEWFHEGHVSWRHRCCRHHCCRTTTVCHGEGPECTSRYSYWERRSPTLERGEEERKRSRKERDAKMNNIARVVQRLWKKRKRNYAKGLAEDTGQVPSCGNSVFRRQSSISRRSSWEPRLCSALTCCSCFNNTNATGFVTRHKNVARPPRLTSKPNPRKRDPPSTRHDREGLTQQKAY